MIDAKSFTSADGKRFEQIEYISLWQAEKAIRIEMGKLYHDNGGFMRCPKYPDAEEKNDLWLHMKETADFLKSKRVALLNSSTGIPDWIAEFI